jgi:hypothetical protein
LEGENERGLSLRSRCEGGGVRGVEAKGWIGRKSERFDNGVFFYIKGSQDV